MDPISKAKRCLDTYALFEIAKNSPAYENIAEEGYVLPDLALVEFYDLMFRRSGEEAAERWRSLLELRSLPVPRDILVQAQMMRRKRKELNLSLSDAAGYLLAQHLGIPFVTGDKAFEGMTGVDFRK